MDNFPPLFIARPDKIRGVMAKALHDADCGCSDFGDPTTDEDDRYIRAVDAVLSIPRCNHCRKWNAGHEHDDCPDKPGCYFCGLVNPGHVEQECPERPEPEPYHMAGDAYCTCDIGEDHEGDAEADEAWGKLGPMGLAELHAKRQGKELDRYRAALENIKALGCIRLLDGSGATDCSDVSYTCAQCMAAAALEEKS